MAKYVEHITYYIPKKANPFLN